MEAVSETFKTRLNPPIQAPKMADVCHIENVWGIIKDKVAKTSYQNDRDLRQAIISAWKEVNSDKDLCRNLVAHIPKRFCAVIEKKKWPANLEERLLNCSN